MRAGSVGGTAQRGAGTFEAAGRWSAIRAQRAAISALAAATTAAPETASATWMAWAALESEILAALRAARGPAVRPTKFCS